MKAGTGMKNVLAGYQVSNKFQLITGRVGRGSMQISTRKYLPD